MRTLSAVFALAASCCLLAACGSSTTKISKNDLAKEVQSKFDAIARARGAKFPATFKCPKDLENKKGATTRCTAKGADGTLGVTATVVSVDGNKAQLRFKGDSALSR